jgi:hypothetical protein
MSYETKLTSGNEAGHNQGAMAESRSQVANAAL